MKKVLEDSNSYFKRVPQLLQIILNCSLIILATILSILLIKELWQFIIILWQDNAKSSADFLQNILVFFIYFEFITMIVKYFKEDYHFPLRYFIYIGITAMLRLIIIEHHNPWATLAYALVILALIIGYFIINITPLERPKRDSIFTNRKIK
ncbi:phosphate-starvation-inducible protein PsiE [Kurthia sibirica]|uniref:Protein PsiE n=1 Tax=Kurthia sibirica TaxID=202750 RepID=A0A2U3APJ8_9BACL|nr:phosphate-starvation-inducible protein PsiE [Kurthia sibirica]PWI26480.1 phosphate-starvation-inducible protein PsiE [Kurthia sibirica]GEK33049.1 protein PsiE [Kurthia sibirica]